MIRQCRRVGILVVAMLVLMFTQSLATDGTAPSTTTIDAVEGNSYTGNQTFTLTATDNVGAAGVESTWWQHDNSGGGKIGTSIPVPAPTTGTAAHMIKWYSRDNVANQETQQSVTFNVSASGS